MFVAIASLRADNIGIDTIVYKEAFLSYFKNESFRNIVINERFEPLFSLVCYFLSIIGSFFLLKLFVALVNVGLVLHTVNKYSSIVWLSCLLFFLFAMYRSNFNEMRQAIALGITAFGFQYVIEKKLIKYLIVIFIAYLFHKSALIMIPLYFFCLWKRITIWQVAIISGLCALIFIVAYQFVDIINFIGRNEYTQNEETGGWSLFALQILTIVISFIKRKELNKSRANICCFYMVASTIILFPICHLNPTFFRMEFYPWIYMIILVPNFLTSFKTKFIKYAGIIAYIVIGIYTAFTVTYIDDTQLVPYHFLWE